MAVSNGLGVVTIWFRRMVQVRANRTRSSLNNAAIGDSPFKMERFIKILLNNMISVPVPIVCNKLTIWAIDSKGEKTPKQQNTLFLVFSDLPNMIR